jgi:hypothetical protein
MMLFSSSKNNVVLNLWGLQGLNVVEVRTPDNVAQFKLMTE